MIPILSISPTDIPEQKFCIKCSHLLGNRSYPENWKIWRCSKTQAVNGTNLVTGETIYSAAFCDNVRQNESTCGPEGKWYEEYIKPSISYQEPFMPLRKPRIKISESDLDNL